MSHDLKNLPIVQSGLTDDSVVFGAKEGQSDSAPDPISVAALWEYTLSKVESDQQNLQDALGIAELAETAETSAAAAVAAAESAAASAASAVEVTGALPRVDRTTLKALDTDQITVAYLTEPGREGMFRWRTGDYSTQVSADTLEGVYIEADDVSSSSGAWERVFEGGVQVKWFGISGDGTTDQSAALAVADSVAAMLGLTLVFSPGTYRCWNVNPSAPWMGDINSPEIVVIKGNDRSSTSRSNAPVQKSGGTWACAGITLDGWVSDDPDEWTSENYNTFVGGGCLVLIDVAEFHLLRCRFMNGLTGVNAHRCSNGRVLHCHSERQRGNFGDGYYNHASHHIRYIGCTAEDYTRIGFVSEGNSTNGPSTDIRYFGCLAINGHDGSSQYGGTESNVGFWAENTVDVHFTSCFADQQWRGGFFVHGGATSDDYEVNPVTMSQCSVGRLNEPSGSRERIAFRVTAGPGAQFIAATLTGCTAQSGWHLFFYGSADGGMRVECNNCGGCPDDSDNNRSVFFHEPGNTAIDTLIVNGGWSKWNDLTNWDSNQVHKGDVVIWGTPAPGPLVIHIRGFRNETTYAKFISRASVPPESNTNQEWIVEDCEAFIYVNNMNGNARIRGGKVNGALRLRGTVDLENTQVRGTATLEFYHARVKGRISILEGGRIYLTTDESTKRVMADLQLHVDKDLSGDDNYAVRFDYNGTEKPTIIVSGVLRESSGTSPAANFLFVDHSGSRVVANGLVTDDTIAKALKVSSSEIDFTGGEQRVEMH